MTIHLGETTAPTALVIYFYVPCLSDMLGIKKLPGSITLRETKKHSQICKSINLLAGSDQPIEYIS